MKKIIFLLFIFLAKKVPAIEINGLNDFLIKFATESELIKAEIKNKDSAINSFKKSNAAYYPNLNGYVQGSKTDSLESGNTNTTNNDFRTQSYLKLSQNLYNGGSDQSTIESAQLEIKKSEQKMSNVYYEVLQSGLDNFFKLLKAKAEIENIKLEITNNQKSLRELQRNLSNGLARKSQVKTLEVALANNFVDQNTALNNYEKVKSSIYSQSSLNAEDYVAKVELKLLEDLNESKFAIDLKKRADVNAAIINEAMMQNTIDISKSGKLPKLDLSANYYLSDSSKTNSLKNMYSAQITLSIPFPFGDEKNMPIENSVNSLLTAKYQTKTIEKNLVVEFDGLNLDYKNSIQQVKALKTAYELSEKNAENLQADYRSGLVSYGEYLSAYTTFQQIKRKLDQSKIEKLYLEEKIKLWIHGAEGYLK